MNLIVYIPGAVRSDSAIINILGRLARCPQGDEGPGELWVGVRSEGGERGRGREGE